MAANIEFNFAAKNPGVIPSAFDAATSAIARQNKVLSEQMVKNKEFVAEMNRRRAAQREENEAARQGAALMQALATPQERYMQRSKELSALLQRGAIDEQTYQRARAAAGQEYLKASGANDRAAEAQRRNTEAVRDAQRVIDGVTTAEQRYESELARLNGHLQAGRLNQEQHTAAVAAAKRKLDEETGATAAATARQREHDQRLREARALMESVRTPAERYRAELNRLNEMLRVGSIDQQTHSRAVREARKSFEETEGAANKVAGVRFDGFISGIRGIGAAILGGGALAGLNQMADAANRIRGEANQRAVELGPKIDAALNQANLEGVAAGDARGRVFDIAERRAIPVEKASGVAAELAGAGVAQGEAFGSALNVVLKAVNATNAKEGNAPVDESELAKAAIMFVKSRGIEKPTTKDFESALGGVYAVFKDTSLQLADLQNLAGQAAVAQGNMTQEESIALYAALRDTKNAADASTAFRQIALKLATASSNPEAVKAIEGLDANERAKLQKAGKPIPASLGLKVEDIDLTGESVDVVVDRIKKALEQIGEKDRLPLLKQMVGEEGAAAFSSLISKGGDRLRKDIAAQKSPDVLTNLDRDAAKIEQSPARVAVRQQVQRDRILLERADGADIVQRELQNFLLERGAAAHSADAAAKAFEKTLGVSGDQEAALKAGLSVAGYGTEQVKEVQARVNRNRRGEGRVRQIDNVPGIGVDPGTEANAQQIEQTGGLFDARAEQVRRRAKRIFNEYATFRPEGYENFDSERALRQTEEFLKRQQADAMKLKPGELEDRGANFLERFALEPRQYGPGGKDRNFRSVTHQNAIDELRAISERNATSAAAAAAAEQQSTQPGSTSEARQPPATAPSAAPTTMPMGETAAIVVPAPRVEVNVDVNRMVSATFETNRLLGQLLKQRETPPMVLRPGSRTPHAAALGATS